MAKIAHSENCHFFWYNNDPVTQNEAKMILNHKNGQIPPQKGQIDKTPATPVADPRHQNSERKSYLKVGPIATKAIFGQKMAKKCRLALLRGPSGKVLKI